MGRIVLKYWNCPQCGTKDISGGIRECPNCGKPRAEGVSYHFKANEKPVYVSEETAEVVRKRGHDWECKHCNSMNSGLDSVCFSCGAPREEQPLGSDKDTKIVVTNEQGIDIDGDTNVGSSTKEDIKSDGLFTPQQLHISPVKRVVPFKKILPFIITGFVVLVIVGIIFLCQPKDVEFKIIDMSWSYSIDIQKLTLVEESDWTMPSGARLQRTASEFHHYEQVFDHYKIEYKDVFDGYEEEIVGYKDLGNGYAEEIIRQVPKYHKEEVKVPVYRDEPVYATKYYYEVDKWLYERSVTTSAYNKEPYWGEVVLGENEKEGSRTTTYILYGVSDADKSYECKVDYNTWLSCEIEDVVKGKLDIFGNFVLDTSGTSSNMCIVRTHIGYNQLVV